MPMPTSFHLLVLLPTIILTVGACVLLLSEDFLKRKERGYQAWVAGGSALLAFFAALALVDGASPAGPILKGAVRGDAFQDSIGAAVCAGELGGAAFGAPLPRAAATRVSSRSTSPFPLSASGEGARG